MKFLTDRVRGISLFDVDWQLPNYFHISILKLYVNGSLFRFFYAKDYAIAINFLFKYEIKRELNNE